MNWFRSGNSKRNTLLNFGVEQLEDKILLAGDVTVTVTGSNIDIVGQADSNTIQIFQNDVGELVVQGLEDTTINGVDAIFNTSLVAGQIQNVSIDMRGGDDFVDLVMLDEPVGISGDLTVKMGQDGDSLFINVSEIAGDVTVRMGGGVDGFDIERTTILGDMDFSGGGGNDFSLFGIESEVTIMGTLTTRNGGGDDYVGYGDSAGLFTVGNLNDLGGGGNDEMNFDGFVLGDFFYSGGGGEDIAVIGFYGNAQIDGDTELRGGAANDIIEFGAGAFTVTSLVSTSFFGGRGEDTVTIGANADFQGALDANMGQDDDTLNIATGVTAVLPGILTGGDGVDSLSPSEAELEALGFNVIRFEN